MSAARVSKGLDEPIRLEKVLGVTSLSNAALALCPVTGFVAYAAGSNNKMPNTIIITFN